MSRAEQDETHTVPHLLSIPARAQVRRSPIPETPRLLLVPIDSDGDELWDAVEGSRWHLERWLPWVPFNSTREASMRYAEACVADWDGGRAVRFAIRDRHSRELLGVVGLDSCVHLHRSCELGYWLRRDATGKGLMTEAANASVEFAFSRMAMHRIRCAAATDNFPSLRVIQRLGFRFEGIARQAELVQSRWLDHAVFAKLSQDECSIFPARRRQVPFLVLAPSLVVVVGVLAAFLMAALGTRELGIQSDAAAALRAELLAITISERLRATPEEDRTALVERAARRSGAELLLVQQNGGVVVDGTQGVPKQAQIVRLLVKGDGETVTETGRRRYFAAPVDAAEPLSVLSFVAAPEVPFAGSSLVVSVALLTTLLVGAAALVALALARDVYSDVTFVQRRIQEMAEESADPADRKPVPVRSVDQVGLLAASFNVLVDRFAAAEEAYRQDLTGAQNYDRERSAFLAALSHELRTPLNAILGFADVLLAEVDGPLTEDARENLSVIRSSGEHLRALIDDILDLSALESGELRLSSRPVDVYPIAQEVVREAGITASAKGLTLELTGKPATAFADPRRVRQIIGNIVGNAIKFTSKGGVTVRVDPRDGGVSISIADTGPGIASSDHEAIFREFFQTGEARRQRVGTGLGLAITRRLVQMHRGFIDLRSQLGRGSLFTIVLPAQPPPEPKPAEPIPPPPKSRPRAEPVT